MEAKTLDQRLLAVKLGTEQDVVLARQRARQVAQLAGFGAQDQTRIATAVSEIARNAFRYAQGGRVEYSISGNTAPQLLFITVSDHGGGIADLKAVLEGRYKSDTGMGIGLLGARRLMDRCEIETGPTGTRVTMAKLLPRDAPLITTRAVGSIATRLVSDPPANTFEEVRQQNRELLEAFKELKDQHEELQRITRELEDTNRGVVALYAELDETANHLRRADDMKSRFLSNMSHEFRTPLSSIRALSNLLLRHTDGPLTEEQTRQVKFILQGAENLSELVNDLLDLAKIEAGRVDVHVAEMNIADLFSAMRGMLRPLLVTNTVELTFEVAPEVPLIQTDEAKVSQIVRNFISNALKFTKAGSIAVRADMAEDGAAVDFSVRDTGIGIPATDLGLIFEEFTQVPNEMQKSVKGTGLGLPLCKKLAQLIGGTVRVQSTLGSGSTFIAHIPLQAPQKTSPLPAAPGRAVTLDLARIPILVVEDDMQVRMLYENYLRDSPYQSVAAGSVNEARALLERVAPKAVILDILLQGENTWNWLAELKSSSGAQVPVIVATSVEDKRKGLALGADAYFVKPLERAELLAALDALVVGKEPAGGIH